MIRDFTAGGHAGLEFAPPAEMSAAQDALLVEHLRYVAARSPFYMALFRRSGLDPESVRGVKDLPLLACTTKDDLTRHCVEFVACPQEDIADVCLTSATSGNAPNILLQTHSDLARLAYNEASAFGMMGIGPGDTIAICAAIDRCFMAGLAYYLGGLKIGARMVRAGAGSAAQHWHLIKTTKATVLVGVPSFIRKIGQYAVGCNEDPSKAGIRLMVAIGEGIRDNDLSLLPMAQGIEEAWGAPMYSTYASTEMATAFCECRKRRGGHLRPELIVAEIVDDDGNPVAPGQTGEVVVTPLGVTGMPLVRFRTGDISRMSSDPCGCGRTAPRLHPVLGRKNQMLKVKGTTVFPSCILSAVEGLDCTRGAYVEAARNDDGTDRVTLYVAAGPSPNDELITRELRARVRVVPHITFISEDELNAKTYDPEKRKRVTFFDMR